MSKDMIRVYIRKLSQNDDTANDLFAAIRSYAEQQKLALPLELRIEKTSKGKPYLFDLPNLHFSLSHSGEYWFCAIANKPLGIDVQKHEDCRMDSIAKRFFDPAEYAWLKENDYAEFFPVWAAKESFVKYFGQGIDEGFADFSVISDNAIAREILGVQLRFIPFFPEYSVCVCAEDTTDLRVQWLK